MSPQDTDLTFFTNDENQTLLDRFYDPNHPVRNNLETLDSVDVVRTIREALKK